MSAEKCVEMKGDYVEKNSKVCFISVTLKSCSGRKLLDPITYDLYHICYQNASITTTFKTSMRFVNSHTSNSPEVFTVTLYPLR